jgi:hypothetical protein
MKESAAKCTRSMCCQRSLATDLTANTTAWVVHRFESCEFICEVLQCHLLAALTRVLTSSWIFRHDAHPDPCWMVAVNAASLNAQVEPTMATRLPDRGCESAASRTCTCTHGQQWHRQSKAIRARIALQLWPQHIDAH